MSNRKFRIVKMPCPCIGDCQVCGIRGWHRYWDNDLPGPVCLGCAEPVQYAEHALLHAGIEHPEIIAD